MGKYFGTDGIRGVANTELTPEFALKLGRILGHHLKEKNTRPKVLIGRDTRISGELLESALIAGLVSSGADVLTLGVITTPGVAYLTKNLDVDAGVMISASHNPVQDNGIKIFSHSGYKLSDQEEEEIEALIDSSDELPRPIAGEIGRVEDFQMGSQKYVNFIKGTVGQKLTGLKIVLDCANGASSALAPQLFADLDADIVTVSSNPDGININHNCGSTHPENLAKEVVKHEAHLGFAFDGDCDRLIAVDHNGNIIDGDYIMFIVGRYLNEKGLLKQGTVVSTVMSNLGFYNAVEANGLHSVQTKVGDRYVLEEMLKNDYNFGGEQSGHLIFLDYGTTGDGMLSAVQLAKIIVEKGQSLADLAKEMPKYPQLLKNLRVEDKNAMMTNEAILAVIAEVEAEMNGKGRVLVRPSGTEPLVRVMVEAETEELCESYVERILAVVEKELK
ncbi:phosphoglucosamine mutase [Turicibacter sanguinis]|jgi:phosphoglucosamine mutase|uniref:phosphoglucosamine mutase n=1 Tax=Turicibacter sanguinis TaxID=154288 RepID=UPI0011C99601|nr:phosphoglucosamine mutase [Turicibacter sanguinis]MDB8541625.1 phosphoglucosamine mutase [Turicibacter sanguinis]MDB8545174.1 phosphoglucosamine mutase [Turicibacter sanguinis]MDB8552345.1 phosphoglucosamine mutase [Turicibacter sanguinis]MDB8554527.1 phosphoglucosamine mutase [Turicibacter sanguinis]MDB8557646.1 phosphoglucosamine mutase [Turicibacter sanguinis]